MNIATLSVGIDPTAAIAGAAAVATACATVVASMRGITAAMSTIGQGRGGFAAIAAAARAAATSMGTFFNRATLGVSGAIGLMARNVIADFRAIGNAIKGSAGFLREFGLAINGLKSLMAPFTGAISQAFDFVKESISTAADMESTELAIRGLLSNATKAKAMMGELQTLAKNTTLSFPETADAARQLLSYGIAADKIIPSLKRLADLSALTGGKSSITDLAYLYGTAATQAHVYTRDINQFATRGIDLISALSLTMKKGKSELMDMVKDGKVGFGDLEKAIVSMTQRGGIAFGAQAIQMESWNGKVSKLEESWTLLKQAVGEPIIDGLKPLLDDLTSIVDNFTIQIKEMAPAIREVVEYIPAAFRVMRQEGGLKLAFEAATDFLGRKLLQLWEFTKAYLGAVFDWIYNNFAPKMKILASAEFWAGVGSALAAGAMKALKVIGEGVAKMYTDPVQYVLDQNKAELETVSQNKRRAEVIKEIVVISDRQKGNYSEYGGPNTYYGGPDTLGGAPRKQLDDAMLADLNTELNTLNKNLNEGNTSLFPTNAAGVPFKPPAWSDFETAPSATENEFGAATKTEVALEKFRQGIGTFWNGILGGSKAQERAAEERANNLNILNEGGEDKPSKSEARKAAAAAKAAERADAALQTTAARLSAQADPAEKYNQRLALIQKLADAGKISTERQTQLEHEAAMQYELDMAKKVKATEKAATAMATPLQKLAAEWGNIQKQAAEASVNIAQSIAGNITTGFMDMITGAKSVGEAFEKMALSIVNDIAKIIVQLLVQLAISKAIKGVSGGGGGGIFGGIFGAIFHDGGTVGGPAPARAMSGSTLSSARRFHSGGVAGLNAGEVPAILERGEHVMTAREASRQKRKLMGKSDSGPPPQSGPPVIVNLSDPAQIPAIMAQYPQAILNIIHGNRREIRASLGNA
jgi:hypothetical protein